MNLITVDTTGGLSSGWNLRKIEKNYLIEKFYLTLFDLTPMYTSKTYLSFGTDSAHVVDVTGSLIIGNENIDQNVQLE